MIEIGENLKLERFEIHNMTDSEFQLKSISGQHKVIPFIDIQNVEIIGIKSNSGYSGTTEWGMSNPTVLLPTIFWYNILNWFKRKGDMIHYKITLTDGFQLIACSCDKNINKEISQRI